MNEALIEQITKIAEAVGVGNKYKFESLVDGVSISYTKNGQKYLLNIKEYPYSR